MASQHCVEEKVEKNLLSLLSCLLIVGFSSSNFFAIHAQINMNIGLKQKMSCSETRQVIESNNRIVTQKQKEKEKTLF